ncbi:MAG: DUF2344 domain-containing protein [Anaerolineales bacterium]|nr:DUF2344 domain-containing protein [Anaerolineales bacterium]
MRYRIEYSKEKEMRYTGHLDLLRAWERTFRRAKLPVAYTHGYHPHARINLGIALPLGFTSECELTDIWFTEHLDSIEVKSSLEPVLPPGLRVKEILEIDLSTPSLQQCVLAAEYMVHLDPTLSDQELQAKVDALLSSEELLRIRREKTYDLRPLIEDLHIDDKGVLRMRLTAKEGATGRPEEVLLEMGLDPTAARIHRTRFILRQDS